MAENTKSTFLVTDENPDGWKIEEILTTIQNDILRRTQKLVGDQRPEARTVINNNIEILGLLSNCIERATDSTQVLHRAFGPSVEGKPRIGVL
jgi:hypothetical protein